MNRLLPHIMWILSLLLAAPSQSKTNATENFFKVRCSLDGRDIYTAWEGRVYLQIKDQKQKHLFNVTGMNVARCFKEDNGEFFITSRELLYYHDPVSGKVLDRWENHLIEETVPVMHVANSLVQFKTRAGDDRMGTKYYDLGDKWVISQDVNLTYPNPLSFSETFAVYSPDKLYQASELFKFIVDKQDVFEADTIVENVHFTWDRIGPILPWMKMGSFEGHLIYSAQGKKLKSFAELPEFIKYEILTRIPLYLTAPKCYLSNRNVSSWTYFAKHFDSYLQGVRFPVLEDDSEEQCL